MTMTAETKNVNRDKKLQQVQALLAKADSTEFPEEADALRKKADDLMLAYTIEQWEVDAKKPIDQRQRPVNKKIKVAEGGSPIRESLMMLFSAIARHNRCKLIWLDSSYGEYPLWAHTFGMDADVEYVQMVFTSLYVQMSNNLEPKNDPHLSEVENLVAMKESGMKWERIHSLLHPDQPWERRHGVRYTGMYTRYCKEHNRERLYVSPATFVQNYSSHFVLEVNRRLTEIADAQRRDAAPGTDLVLRDMSQEINDMLTEAYPKTSPVKYKGGKFNASAARRGTEAGSRADLGQRGMSNRKEIG